MSTADALRPVGGRQGVGVVGDPRVDERALAERGEGGRGDRGSRDDRRRRRVRRRHWPASCVPSPAGSAATAGVAGRISVVITADIATAAEEQPDDEAEPHEGPGAAGGRRP